MAPGAADWNIQNRVEGEEFRRFSSVLVDGELLIDPGPHIFDYAEKSGQPDLFAHVKDIIVTHSHGDHSRLPPSRGSVLGQPAPSGLTVRSSAR